ncbi:VOC family protein [Lentzea sp. DG1S-22]|uniref:VOC family protein n=1 Tax=Lentzea sp. DG1S-22 TaxID=3108822 RepID=UPI002E797FC6|nr:VOC family protein [Lentzea sp. DG1S-22]WVH81513.1 VOC family protein [Lentzea sp. DG1S-22]
MSGQVNWFELPADDTGRARAFYAGVFGWDTSPMGEDYHVITNGAAGAIAAGDAQLTQPRIYFHTADIDASVLRVAELGGKAEDVQAVPEVGRIAHCTDDQGTPFSLYEPQG